MMGFVQPPITFQPPPPPGSNASSAAQQPKPAAPGPSHPDLLTRYNLKDKVDGDAEGSSSSSNNNSSGPEASGGQGSGKAWSSNRDERQSLLQKRRDQMILEARRKMAAKLAADKAAEGAAS